MYNNKLLIKGFIDKEIPAGIDPVAEIKRMCKEKNAVILAHYYQEGKIQDLADYVGDSLYLSQQAEKTKANIIVFCGVHFMAETAKIISPEKKVLLPDLNAGCSLADSCKAEDFKNFLKNYPDYKVISYINTSAEIKALSNVICTSSNAIKVVESFNKEEKLIFAPDRNLGNYIRNITGRDMVIWDGACHVHEEFSVERILDVKKEYPTAKVLAHPECSKPVLLLADYIGSTTSLLHYSIKDDANTYIVATEPGIIHQMKKESPKKIFLAAPPKDSSCGCNDCRFMKMNTIEKLYNCLNYEMPEILIKKEIQTKAVISINRMLDISKKAGF